MNNNCYFEIPFVFMSGNSDPKTYERARATNPLGFIKKPIDEGRFIELFSKYLSTIN